MQDQVGLGPHHLGYDGVRGKVSPTGITHDLNGQRACCGQGLEGDWRRCATLALLTQDHPILIPSSGTQALQAHHMVRTFGARHRGFLDRLRPIFYPNGPRPRRHATDLRTIGGHILQVRSPREIGQYLAGKNRPARIHPVRVQLEGHPIGSRANPSLGRAHRNQLRAP